MERTMLDYALGYAKKGWYVFPVRERPGKPYEKTSESGEKIVVTPKEKTPYISKGLDSATLDVDQIKAWWGTWPNAMIGVNCEKSGLFVIDLDKKSGTDGIGNFSDLGINDGGALHSSTPSGGMHIVFSGKGKSSANGKTGIDTRGEGGYFIVPPSEVTDGKNTGKYKYIDDWKRVPAPVPDGMMLKLFPQNTLDQTSKINFDGSGEKGLLSRSTLLYLVEGAVIGERNDKLFKVACDFKGCGYPLEEADKILWPKSSEIGWTRDTFLPILNNAYSKERNPSIPVSLQEKLKENKNVASKITPAEQSILEEALLACMIEDNSLIVQVSDIVTKDDFTSFDNQLLFNTILKLHNDTLKVDTVTLTGKGISLEKLSKIVDKYDPNIENAVSYAYIIKEISAGYKFQKLMNQGLELYKSGKSLLDVLNGVEKNLADLSITSGIKTSATLSSKQATEMVVQQTQDLLNGKIKQVNSGFTEYDNETDGFYPGSLLMVTGRPGEGKSALMLSLMNNIGIKSGLPVLFFTLEMSTKETICRLICQLTGLPYKNVFRGKLDSTQWIMYKNAVDIINSGKIFFDDSSGLTVSELKAKARKWVDKEGVSFIGIDQLEQFKDYGALAEHIRYDRITYDVKGLAKELDIPMALCHQLNRNITNRNLKGAEPELSDLSQAGEKAPNEVWAIVHKKDENGKIIASKIKILKNRNGSKDIPFPVAFVQERMLFSNAVLTKESENFLKEKDYLDEDEPEWAKE